jgi:nondiscriminating glutamyl-tRNA synthetase
VLFRSMKITHVIRAEEHLSNTPRQILLYQALNLPLPQFGHISLILGKDRSKMSKRHGATSVEQYKNLGYLPEGLVNFLALLGWAPPGEQEIFSPAELIEQFSMDRVAKNPAVFDIDKLNHINAHYIKQASPELVTELALPHLKAAGYIGEELNAGQREWLVKVVAELQGYISYAAQIIEHIDVFFNDAIDFESEEAHDIMKDADIPRVMEAFKNRLTALETVEPAAVQAILKGITKELKLGGKKVYMPVRIAITGKMHGPELINLIPLIGRERTLARMDSLIAKI